MNRVPCKKCPQCGLFNDFTIEECECGKKLNNIGAQFINTDELSPEQYGEIDVSLKVYVQKCSACGALNYTDNPSNPVKVCYNCHKTRIAAIVPVEYVDTDSSESEDEAVSEIDELSGVNNLSVHTNQCQTPQVNHSPTVDDNDDDDDDDDDDDSVQWQGILGNIQKTVGSSPVIPQPKPSQQSVKNTIVTPIASDDDDDDDDDEVGDWSGILGNKVKQNTTTPKFQVVTPAAKKDITLTAIRYGRLSFTVEAGPNTYMLGRSANEGSFLSQDGRVGNEHCYIFYRNGNWFVKDNNSRNGTAVNSRDIGLNGECMLSDGDELKLGHHNDSVAFRISIG